MVQKCMIEHLMAAFHGLGVDNLVVELDGPSADFRWLWREYC